MSYTEIDIVLRCEELKVRVTCTDAAGALEVLEQLNESCNGTTAGRPLRENWSAVATSGGEVVSIAQLQEWAADEAILESPE